MAGTLRPVTRKANITQAQADKAVREYRSMHGIVCRSQSVAIAKQRPVSVGR